MGGNQTAYGFFDSRRPLKLKGLAGGNANIRFADYQNIPPVIATLVSKKMASLIDLQTIYGVKDAYDLLEIYAVDSFNQELLRQKENK